MKALCLLLVFVAGACSPRSENRAPSDTVPDLLSLSIGGLGGSHRVTLQPDGRLEHVTPGAGGGRQEKEIVTIPPGRWAAFRSEMDAIGVWQWRGNFKDHKVLDGTQWGIELAYGDRSLSLSGSNRFPKESGKPSGSTGMTEPFKRYLRAVEALLGDGREFR